MTLGIILNVALCHFNDYDDYLEHFQFPTSILLQVNAIKVDRKDHFWRPGFLHIIICAFLGYKASDLINKIGCYPRGGGGGVLALRILRGTCSQNLARRGGGGGCSLLGHEDEPIFRGYVLPDQPEVLVIFYKLFQLTQTHRIRNASILMTIFWKCTPGNYCNDYYTSHEHTLHIQAI